MMQPCNEILIKAIAIGLILLDTSVKQLGNGNTQFFRYNSMVTQQIMAIYCTLKIKEPETRARSPPKAKMVSLTLKYNTTFRR